MISGTVMAANVGNFLPSKGAYTFSLYSEALARLVHEQVHDFAPDICLLQEAWTFAGTIVGNDYEWLGLNDSIAVKKSFGRIVPGSFTSHSLHFVKHAGAPVDPPRKGKDVAGLLEQQRARLLESPYDGTPSNPYGIPVDFDVTGAVIETVAGDTLSVANVHVTSASWNDETRAREIRDWILDGAVSSAAADTGGRVIIGGDFNCDEDRQAKQESASAIKEILAVDGMNDAAAGDKSVTTNYPRFLGNYRYDHLLGTATFSDYAVDQSLRPPDLAEFRRRHRFTWWMHLDHQNVRAHFTVP